MSCNARKLSDMFRGAVQCHCSTVLGSQPQQQQQQQLQLHQQQQQQQQQLEAYQQLCQPVMSPANTAQVNRRASFCKRRFACIYPCRDVIK